MSKYLHIRVDDSNVVIEFRKLLFKYNISLNAFIRYIVDCGLDQDDRIIELMNEASLEMGKSPKQRKNKASADDLYELIEQELEKEQNNQGENDEQN